MVLSIVVLISERLLPLLETMNSEESVSSTSSLHSGLLEQVEMLVANRTERPSWDEYFMSAALMMSLRSACERLHVGCVLVSGGDQRNRIIAAGYNGFLPGAPHASHMRDGHEQATIHAEQNAIADAAKRGISILGSTAFISHYPCLNCAKILVSSGIHAVKYHWDYRNDPLTAELLQESGVYLGKY